MVAVPPGSAGRMATWPSGLGKGLQSPVQGFDSPRRLQLVVGRFVVNAQFSVGFVTANSSGGRDKLGESFGWSIPCEGLAGASVEERSDVVEIVLGVHGQVGALR